MVHTSTIETRTGDSVSTRTLLPLSCYAKPVNKATYFKQRQRAMRSVPINDPKLTELLEEAGESVFQPSASRAVRDLAISLSLVLFSGFCLSIAPWFLTPLVWVVSALAMCLLFDVGHDCAHGRWSSVSLVNRIVGELSFLPFFHPFVTFRHTHTTMNACTTERTDTYKPTVQLPEKKSEQKNKQEQQQQQQQPEAPMLQYAMSFIAKVGLRQFLAIYYDVRRYPSYIRMQAWISVLLSVCFVVATIYGLQQWRGYMAVLHLWAIPLVLYKDTLYPLYLDLLRRGLSDLYLPKAVTDRIPTYRLRAFSKSVKRVLFGHSNGEQPQQQNKSDSPSVDGSEEQEGSKWKQNHAIQLDPAEAKLMVGRGKAAVAASGEPQKRDFRYWLGRIHVINCIILLGTPIAAVYGISQVALTWPQFWLSVFFFYFSAMGITVGYHRLFAHRAFKACRAVQALCVLAGSSALQGSVKWWAGGHRVHHRYTDTKLDPYNSMGGFWYAHIGWMLVHPEAKHTVKADIRDLVANPLIRVQHRFYLIIGPICAFVLPALVSHWLLNDFYGGLVYSGVVRLVLVHHSTFCINSVAHWLGEQPYDDSRTPRDNFLTALLTAGEGYHNYHHSHPSDYRNGIRAWDYDPSKWLIRLLSVFGLTYDLKVFPEDVIQRCKLTMAAKKLSRMEKQLTPIVDIADLPVMTWEEVDERVKDKQQSLVVIDGVVHDVHNFIPEHPGSQMLIRSAIGSRNATQRFRGDTGVYRHSPAAYEVLARFRIARLVDDDNNNNIAQE